MHVRAPSSNQHVSPETGMLVDDILAVLPHMGSPRQFFSAIPLLYSACSSIAGDTSHGMRMASAIALKLQKSSMICLV